MEQLNFLHKCKQQQILPNRINYQPPIRTNHAQQITQSNDRRMLNVLISDAHNRLPIYRQRLHGSRDDVMKTCPLQEKCMTKDIVYKATVTTSNTNSTKHYIGMTASTFKERYRNHIKSFNHKRYSNDTELSKYIWKLKDNKQDFDITWSVLKQSISYTGGSKRCNLCLEEKLCILKDKNKQNLLNKKSEIVSTCNHRKNT